MMAPAIPAMNPRLNGPPHGIATVAESADRGAASDAIPAVPA
jgi:hypothetical protein